MRLPADSTVVFRDDSRAPALAVHEGDGLRWLSADGSPPQSIMRCDDPAALVMPNQRAMLAALALTGAVDRVLNLGFGGGAFERFFHAAAPDVTVLAVDHDQRLAALAQRWFRTPPETVVHTAAAEDWLAQHPYSADLLLVDLYAGVEPAACLDDPAFYRSIADHLQPAGICALNLAPASDDALLASLLALRPALPCVWLRAGGDHGNVVVLAARTEPTPPLAVFEPRAGLDPAHELAQFTRLPARTDTS